MFIKVEVNEKQPNILHNPVTAGCNAKDSLCSFSYNGMATPTLLNVEVSLVLFYYIRTV